MSQSARKPYRFYILTYVGQGAIYNYKVFVSHTFPSVYHACLARWLHGFRASDPGLTRGMATLIRVCERGLRHMSASI